MAASKREMDARHVPRDIPPKPDGLEPPLRMAPPSCTV